MKFFSTFFIIMVSFISADSRAFCDDSSNYEPHDGYSLGNDMDDSRDPGIRVEGNASFGDRSHFTGNVYATGTISIGSDATIDGTLCAEGEITLVDRVTVNGAIDSGLGVTIGHNTTVSGNIDSGGEVSIGTGTIGIVTVTGNIDSEEIVSIGSGASIVGNIGSGGEVVTGQNASVVGDINAIQQVTLNARATVSGDIDSKGIVYIDNRASVTGRINTPQNVTLRDSASVNGNIDSVGDVSIGNDASVVGNIDSGATVTLNIRSNVDGYVCATGGVINYGGDVTGTTTEGEVCSVPDFSEIIAQLENQCSAIFSDPLQSHAANGSLDMSVNTSVNTEDPILTFDGEFDVHDDSCGNDTPCTASGTSSQALTLVSIAKDNNSQVSDIEIDKGESLTLGDESSEELGYQRVLYDQITVEPGGELIFSSRPGEVFEINRLLVKGDAKVSFSAGQYAVYDADFEVEEGGIPEIRTTGDGTVYFFTGDVINTDDPDIDLVFNASIAAGADFTVVAEENVNITRHADTSLHATIYAGGKLNIDGDGDLYGAFSAADISIAAENGGNITIHPENVCATPTPPSAGYYFEIVTSPDALTCEAHDVQVHVKNSDDHTTMTDYSGTITLFSTPTLGEWSLDEGNGAFTAGDIGSATYQFANSDDGIAHFSLFNSVASVLDVTAEDGSARTTSVPITFRPYQFEGELECVQALDGHRLTTANQPFQLTLTAVGKTKESDVSKVIKEYTGSKDLKFWSSYLAPTDPVGFKIEIDGAQINRTAESAKVQSVTFVDGIATVVANYADAGKIQIHARDDAGIGALPEDPDQKDELQGSTITYVNPLRLVISNVTGYKRNNSKEVVSTIANPGTKQTGGGFIRASVPDYADLNVDTFDVTVDAVKDCSDSVLSAKYCEGNYGERTTGFRYDITLNSSLIFPDSTSAQPGTLYSEHGLTQSPPDQGADRGQVTFSNLSFDEVGAIGLSAQSLNYFDIEGNDITSEKDASGEYIVTQVGRFYPGYIAYGDHSFDEGCGDFTYMGAATSDNPRAGSAVTLNYVMQAKAQVANSAAEKTTFNYDAELGYPVAPNANFSHFALSKQSRIDLSNRLLPSHYYDNTQWDTGIYSVNALAMGVKKSLTNTDGPYFESMPKDLLVNEQLEYYIELTGRDGEALQSATANGCEGGICRLPENKEESSLGDFAYGRLQVSNGHGNELQSIRTLIEATYFNGSEFVPLIADSCTPLLHEQLSASPSIDESGNIAIGNSSTLITLLDNSLNSGKGYLQFSAPYSRGTLAYYLRVKDSDNNALYSPWLLDDGNAVTCPSEVGGGDECISGNLQFGLFRGNDRIIYRRQAF